MLLFTLLYRKKCYTKKIAGLNGENTGNFVSTKSENPGLGHKYLQKQLCIVILAGFQVR